MIKQAGTILYKVWVKQFYQANAGLFLFCFLILFGVVEASQIISYHYSLMLAMIKSPVFLALVMCVWLLYASKCIGFCIKIITMPDGGWLYQCRALENHIQWLLFSVVAILLWLPIGLYALVLAVVAWPISVAVSCCVISYQLIVLMLIAGSFYNQINRTTAVFFTNWFSMISKWFRFKARHSSFLLLYFLQQKKAAFLLVKVFSLLLLSVFFVRNADHFDVDLFYLFFPFAITAHANLVLQGTQFNEQWMSANRNLPLHWLQVLYQYAITWLIVMLPELMFLFINNQGIMPISQIAGEWFIAWSALILFTGMAYGCKLKSEPYLLFVFVFYITIIFIQRWLGVWLAASGTFLLGIAVFAAHYYSYEPEKS